MMLSRLLLACFVFLAPAIAVAQPAPGPVEQILIDNDDEVARASRRTVGGVVDALLGTGSEAVPPFLEAWRDKEVFRRESDGRYFYAASDGEGWILTDIDTGAEAGRAGRRDVAQLKPNAGVRGVLSSALVQFKLVDPDPVRRMEALRVLARDPDPEILDPLRASMAGEDVPRVLARKVELERILTARFGRDTDLRLEAIAGLSESLSIEARSALNIILSETREVLAPGAEPEGNVVRILAPGDGLGRAEALAILRDDSTLPAAVSREARDAGLVANIDDGAVAGVPVASLDSEAARWDAYDILAGDGAVPARAEAQGLDTALDDLRVAVIYREDDTAVTDAARSALDSVETRVARAQMGDLALDALSLASIYFLAAIGLAVTFGVMGVINMAHGEFIMMGAYTGYVVQQIVPDYTLSLVVALPLAFLVAGAAGVALERLVIRHLMHRPLETLLATFGISIALQQLAKNVFGTQARPLTSPDWLAGAWAINDVVSIAWIRVAIFALAVVFLVAIVLVLTRTRLGLEVRAVTQNPGMAASMGIDPGRIGMLTFGLGSGIAGVAGVAIGLYAQVTSEMGAGYIVQSFMTVVVGGVGSVFGTLAGAGLIGGLQKGIEWLNPSNTLAAQTYMILFIIAFIQFRPRGIVPQRGRAAT